MTLRYPIRLEPDEDTVLAICPLLPEVTTFGENEAAALRHARDAVEEALAARISDGKEIPAPPVRPRGRTVTLPALTAIKVELYWALRAAKISRAELARRLSWNRESVDRLFRLDHASRLDQMEAAFAALGRRIDISIARAA
jgi:antitoxin HicB